MTKHDLNEHLESSWTYFVQNWCKVKTLLCKHYCQIWFQSAYNYRSYNPSYIVRDDMATNDFNGCLKSS